MFQLTTSLSATNCMCLHISLFTFTVRGLLHVLLYLHVFEILVPALLNII